MRYSHDMHEVRELMFEIVEPANLGCKIGFIYYSFYISKNRSIRDIDIRSGNEALKKEFTRALDQIHELPPGVVNWKNVYTYIYTYLPFNFKN